MAAPPARRPGGQCRWPRLRRGAGWALPRRLPSSLSRYAPSLLSPDDAARPGSVAPQSRRRGPHGLARCLGLALRLCGLVGGGLQGVELGVETAVAHQGVVVALLDHPPVVEHVDAVRVPDAG